MNNLRDMPSEVSELMHGKEKINVYFSIKVEGYLAFRKRQKKRRFQEILPKLGEGIQFMEDHKYNLHADMLK